MKKIILIALLLIVVVMQFISVDRSVPQFEASDDFLTVNEVPDEVASLIKVACYDCHSYQTEYPWYASVAPISFWLNGHVTHGRSKLNFNTLGKVDLRDIKSQMKECAEVVEEKRMPLLSYMIGHKDAWLSEDEREVLINWFKAYSKN